jgi:hypothetical protein
VSAVRVELPTHLQRLAAAEATISVDAGAHPTIAAVLDVIEADYPMLRGTIRNHTTGARRAYLRFYACGKDLSHDLLGDPLPEAVAAGQEPLRIVGAIAGG